MADQIKDYKKLCIKNVENAEIDRVINMCKGYGGYLSFNRPKGSTTLLFPLFSSEDCAAAAKAGLTQKGFSVDYANTKRPEASITEHLAEFNERRPHGVCIKCGQKAFYNCERCGDFYCSQDCQIIDWPTHKQRCIPMPALKLSEFPRRLGKSMENRNQNDTAVREVASTHPINDSTVASTSASISDDQKTVRKSSNDPINKSPQQEIHPIMNGNDSERSSTTVINLPASESIPNDSGVMITYVRSHNMVYIRSVATDAMYTALLAEIYKASFTASSLKSYPCPKQDIVLAPFGGDYYYRGLVLECNECSGLVRIAFIDFGNTEEVEFSKLKILPDELKQRPRLILLVKLKNVKDNPEADERLAMKEYLEKNSEEHTDKVLEVHGDAEYIEKNDTVELLDMDSKESINERLNRLIK